MFPVIVGVPMTQNGGSCPDAGQGSETGVDPPGVAVREWVHGDNCRHLERTNITGNCLGVDGNILYPIYGDHWHKRERLGGISLEQKNRSTAQQTGRRSKTRSEKWTAKVKSWHQTERWAIKTLLYSSLIEMDAQQARVERPQPTKGTVHSITKESKGSQDCEQVELILLREMKV